MNNSSGAIDPPASTRPRIVFLVMSAVSRPATVDQLAHALAPHLVLVHHDFSQTQDFPLHAPNVRFVPNPRRTGWAVFGFVDGIFHSLRHAMANLDFDYLQLLSPTCLPIKPLAQFEAHVSAGAQAHFDCIDLLRDRDALMSVGYRAFTPERSFRHRVLRRLSQGYFGPDSGRRDEAGIWLRSGAGKGAMPWIALAAVKALCPPWIGQHIFDNSFRPYYGSAWFGARRHVVGGMVEVFSRPGVRDYFSGLRISDEFLIPTLLMHLGPPKGPMNHFIQRYNQAHPGVIEEADIAQLARSGAYFARKFADDPAEQARVRVLRELARVDPLLPLDSGLVSAPRARPVSEDPCRGNAGVGGPRWPVQPRTQ
ncbi:MAG TPA: hypothetical protein VLJ58_20275 [Ramlibacter sp.]|nr:hypothetical protein [Ramlibacter sp.]